MQFYMYLFAESGHLQR